MTAFNSRDGGFFLTTVGRVQTPTLAVVVEREESIRKFVSRDYWEIHATFRAAAGDYPGKWFDPKWKKNEDDGEIKADRVWSEARGRGHRRCGARPGGRRHRRVEADDAGQSAAVRPDVAAARGQRPVRLLRQDDAVDRAESVRAAQGADLSAHRFAGAARGLSPGGAEDVPDAREERDVAPRASARPPRWPSNGYIKPSSRIFDNAKVSDHFAIIPTLEAPKHLSEAEQKLYDLVAAASCRCSSRRRNTWSRPASRGRGEHSFKTEGKVLVKPGWLAIYGKEAQDENEGPQSLVPVTPGETVAAETVTAKALKTRPPARYSEATLLGAMEGAGKLIEDDELREAMQEKGLGTPATRASIIEGLLNEKYMIREGRELIPTAKAFQLMTLLRGLGVEELSKPELTGEWEFKLAQIEHGKLERDEFMRQIADDDAAHRQEGQGVRPRDRARRLRDARDAVSQLRRRGEGELPALHLQRQDGTGRTLRLLLRQDARGPHLRARRSRAVPARQADRSARRASARKPAGRSRPSCASSTTRTTRTGSSSSTSATTHAEETGELVDFGDQEPLGLCPKSGGRVFELGRNYVCEHAVRTEAQPEPRATSRAARSSCSSRSSASR